MIGSGTYSKTSARVIKALGIFGGVQITSILCGIVKVKFLALWLGPVGVGLFGIFNSAVDMLNTFSQLGVRQTAVRDIARHRNSPNIKNTISVVRRWGWGLGLLGAVLMIALAPVLSLKTFGSYDKTLSYILLSLALLLSGGAMSEQVVLQGLDRLKRLANSSIFSTIAGLLITLPLFYYLRLDSIIPTILIYYIVFFAGVFLYRAKGMSARPAPDMHTTFHQGIGFIKLGFYLTIADASTQLINYIFIAFLNTSGGDAEVGYYQAGYTLINRYAGLLLMAVAVEYFPRLSAVASSRWKLNIFVAHESYMLTLLLLPFSLLFISFAPFIVSLLYSGEFASTVPFITIGSVGMLLRGMCYCMAYVIIARGDGKIYLVTEIVDGLVILLLNIFAYKFFGIPGLGLSYALSLSFYTFIISLVYTKRFKLFIPRKIFLLEALAVAVTVLGVIIALTFGWLWVLLLAVPSSVICLRLLMRLVIKR